MRIDAHVHIMSPDRLASGLRWTKRYWPEAGADLDLDEDKAVAEMEKAGVSYFFNFFYPIAPGSSRDVNRWNWEFSQRQPRAIPFGSFLPSDEDKMNIIEECVSQYGFVGFKFHPYIQDFAIADPRMREGYAQIQKLGRPIIFHTGYHEFYQKPRLEKELEGILQSYPELGVVIAHGFFPFLEEAFRLLEIYPQLYFDIANVLLDIEANQIDTWWEDIEAYSHRIMFGTDYPLGYSSPETQFAVLESTPLSQTAKEYLGGKTALSFLRRFGGVPPGIVDTEVGPAPS